MAGEIERYAIKLAELQKAKKAATELFRKASSLSEMFSQGGRRPVPIIRLPDQRILGPDGERVSLDLTDWLTPQAVGTVLESWYVLSGEVRGLYRSIPSDLRSTVSTPDEYLVPGTRLAV